MNKKYLVFVGDAYYPKRPSLSFDKIFSNKIEAVNYCDNLVNNEDKYDWADVIDNEGKEVYSTGYAYQ